MSDIKFSPAAIADGEALPLGTFGESIAGNNEYSWYAGDRALPLAVDDAEREFGPELWDKMLNEPILAASDDLLRILVLEDGLTLVPCIDKPDERTATAADVADYQTAVEMRDFCLQILKGLPRDPLDISWDMLDAYSRGHKIAEINLDICNEGELKGKTVITSIKTKPRGVYAFVVDGFMNWRGIIGKMPGISNSLWTGLLADLKGMVNAVSPKKFFLLNFGSRDGDPRGRAALRPCYDPYRSKQLIKPEHLKFLAQFGGGMITATADKDTKPKVNVRAKDGSFTEMALQDAVLGILREMKNGGLAAFPPGVDVEIHVPNATGEAFELAFDRKDREMVIAYLKQTRATQEAKHGSKADSGTATDLLTSVRNYVRRRLCDAWRRCVLWLIVDLNFGVEKAKKFTPNVEMSAVDKPDFAAIASGVATLQAAGWIAEEQKAYYDGLLGAPDRNVDSGGTETPDDKAPGEEDPATAGSFPVQPDESDPRRLQQVDEQRAAKAARTKSKVGVGRG